MLWDAEEKSSLKYRKIKYQCRFGEGLAAISPMLLGKRVRIISVRPPSKEAALSRLEVVDIERVEAPEPHKSGA